MNKHELIAILDGFTGTEDVGEGLRLVKCGRFTGVLTPTTRNRFALPHTRRQALVFAATRQAQLERCMRLGTVLTISPGCLFDEADVSPFIIANENILTKISERLNKAVQFQVCVRWKAEDVLSYFRDAPEIEPLFSGDAITAQRLESAVSQLATRLEAFMWKELSGVAQEVLALPVAEDVLFNAAILLPEVDTLNLDQSVEKIDAIWPEGFSIKQIGPAPAGSFALLSPIWRSAAQVKGAYTSLGLATGVSPSDIADARRKALMTPGCDVGHIREAAEIVEADCRRGHIDKGVFLCIVLSDDQSDGATQRRAVA